MFTSFASQFICVFVMLRHINLGLKYLSWCVHECILALFVICLFIFSEYIFVFAFRRCVWVQFVRAHLCLCGLRRKKTTTDHELILKQTHCCVTGAGTQPLNSFHILILKIKVFLIVTLMMSVRYHKIWSISTVFYLC